MSEKPKRISAIADMDYLHIWRGVKKKMKTAEIIRTLPDYICEDEGAITWPYNSVYKWVADCRKWRLGKKRGGSFDDWNPRLRPNFNAIRKPRPGLYTGRKTGKTENGKSYTPIPEEPEDEEATVIIEPAPTTNFNKTTIQPTHKVIIREIEEPNGMSVALEILKAERDTLRWKLGQIEAAITALEDS